jgi:hypothetical protein
VPFRSILFLGEPPDQDGHEEPPFFADLNLDGVVEAATADWTQYDLKPLFWAPLQDAHTVEYRQEIVRDLQAGEIAGAVTRFTEQMRVVRAHLNTSRKLHHARQKQRWFLDAALVYCDALLGLRDALSELDIRSRGLLGLQEYLAAYTSHDTFRRFHTESLSVREALDGVRYVIAIKGRRVRVSRYRGEPDYSSEIERTFARFQQGAAKDHLTTFHESQEPNPVEREILDLVAKLFPDVFRALEEYCDRHHGFVDPLITTFDREVQFYRAYLDYIRPLQSAGLPFCNPTVSDVSTEVCARDAFDLALAHTLLQRGDPVVCNDLELHHPERIIVVTGPNGGGKTTFARMVGQLHYLGSLGLPVPGTQASLSLPDRIFTHFPREERLATLRGKLEDELVGIRDILQTATSTSLIIMNESFASTTADDTLLLGRAILERIMALGALCVYVTFVDELSLLGAGVVSMVSGVERDDPATRTFKIERRPADGLAYADAIAQKHGLTYEALRRRLLW